MVSLYTEGRFITIFWGGTPTLVYTKVTRCPSVYLYRKMYQTSGPVWTIHPLYPIPYPPWMKELYMSALTEVNFFSVISSMKNSTSKFTCYSSISHEVDPLRNRVYYCVTTGYDSTCSDTSQSIITKHAAHNI